MFIMVGHPCRRHKGIEGGWLHYRASTWCSCAETLMQIKFANGYGTDTCCLSEVVGYFVGTMAGNSMFNAERFGDVVRLHPTRA